VYKSKKFLASLLELAGNTSRSAINPDDQEEMIIDDSVALEMEPIDNEWVHFLAIRALNPGSGQGSSAMKKVMRLVDNNEVYLVGKIRPYDTKIASKEQLRKWYLKFGCKPLDPNNEDGLWIRIPKDKPYKEPVLSPVWDHRINRGYSLSDYEEASRIRYFFMVVVGLFVMNYLFK
jgi:hypothetical protein